ncbi:MAG: hypothetical protein Kow0069_11600 [Promethearchaeota archaeon]
MIATTLQVSSTDVAIGVTIGLLAGVLAAIGLILQKRAVLSVKDKPDEYMRSLFKNKQYLLGVLLYLVLGNIAVPMVARLFIGQGLLQGLSAVGLVVLAAGSVKLLDEKLTRAELVAMCALVGGIVVLASSNITTDIDVEVYTYDLAFFTRLTWATLLIGVAVGVLLVLNKFSSKGKGVLLALVSGSMSALINNFWLDPVIAYFEGGVTGVDIGVYGVILLVFGSLMVSTFDFLSMLVLTRAFNYGEASKLVPVQYVPLLTTPMLSYVFVFRGHEVFGLPPGMTMTTIAVLFYVGTAIILAAIFVLARRQVEVEKIGEEEKVTAKQVKI